MLRWLDSINARESRPALPRILRALKRLIRRRPDPKLPKISPHDYNVGWICAVPIEMTAAVAMLDVMHECLPGDPDDSNTYAMGSIGAHNVVIACLPSGQYGSTSAMAVAMNMRRTFPSIRISLLVGIGGGVPWRHDIRLGDVVVGERVVHYDMAKVNRNGELQCIGGYYFPPAEIMTAVSMLRMQHDMRHSRIPNILSEMLKRYPSMERYASPGKLEDLLFESSYGHLESPIDGCTNCDITKLIQRRERTDGEPRVHYGTIASGSKLIKHGETRDQLAHEVNARCFEMEASGLMYYFPSLVIRGIGNYADSHKSDEWQEYAAAAAAAYAKEFLLFMRRA